MSKIILREDVDPVNVKYYYHKSQILHDNIFTACLFVDDDNTILARGVAIKSLSEPHDKEEGRRRSFKRATKALFSRRSSCPINSLHGKGEYIWKQQKCKTPEDTKELIYALSISMPEAIVKKSINGKVEVVRYAVPYFYPLRVADSFFHHKSTYRPVATPVERILLKPKEES